MRLDEYSEPKGAYYTPALLATYAGDAEAEAAVASLRAAGFTARDISMARADGRVTLVVSEPTPGMIEQARSLLAASAALDVRRYGADVDAM